MKQPSDILLQLDQPTLDYAAARPFGVPKANGGPAVTKPSAPQANPTTIVGTLSGFSDTGFPQVHFSGNPTGRPVDARSTIPLTELQIGRDVLLLFEQGNATKPIIIGLIQPSAPAQAQKAFEVKLDGEQLLLTADKEIVLRCGKSSITLTRAGKVLIRGAYLLSRSSGVNRIKGGSVQIN